MFQTHHTRLMSSATDGVSVTKALEENQVTLHMPIFSGSYLSEEMHLTLTHEAARVLLETLLLANKEDMF